MELKISKLGALWALCSGGWAGLATYVLKVVNEFLATLDRDKLARTAEIVKAIANALTGIVSIFVPPKYSEAASVTIAALNSLATALADGKITQDELDAQVDAIGKAIAAWKAVR